LAVNQCKSLSLSDKEPDTNIVIFHVAKGWGTAAQFSDSLRQSGVLSLPFGPQSVRLVTHLDVSTAQVENACKAIQTVANQGAVKV